MAPMTCFRRGRLRCLAAVRDARSVRAACAPAPGSATHAFPRLGWRGRRQFAERAGRWFTHGFPSLARSRAITAAESALPSNRVSAASTKPSAAESGIGNAIGGGQGIGNGIGTGQLNGQPNGLK
jgi:hypothetical protein